MRNSVQRPPAQHWPVCALLCAAALAWVIYAATGTPSVHKEPPTDEITALTQQTQYPVGTETISIRVTNRGTYAGELQKPYLEMERDGAWYIVKRPSPANETSNLLGVSPGGTAEWEIPLSAYGPALTPGKYRAVFDFVLDRGYFAFQFDIVDTSP